MAERNLDTLADKQIGYTYVGSAPPGTLSSIRAWQIIKVITTGGVSTRYAENDPEFTHIWDDRANYNYTL